MKEIEATLDFGMLHETQRLRSEFPWYSVTREKLNDGS
jgi:hypothetical protein